MRWRILIAALAAAGGVRPGGAAAQHTSTAMPGTASITAATPQRRCIVKRVADGDTFSCTDGTKVRLLLIDAPERDQGPFGKMARRYLLRLVDIGDTVRLEPDVQRRDRYGRLLAYTYLGDGRMVNEEMARAGYVVVLSYPPNVRYLERIRTAVRGAQLAKRGLWSTSAFECTPRDHRRKRC
jgi:micrococcal nuclease